MKKIRILSLGLGLRSIGFCLLLLLQFSAPVLAAQAPEAIAGSTVINSDELIDLVVNTDVMVVIDSRITGDYIRGHIEDAINLPNTETNCRTLTDILPQLFSPVVFYCNGESCLRSSEAISIALACGYKKIYWFRGGFEEWVAMGYPYLKE